MLLAKRSNLNGRETEIWGKGFGIEHGELFEIIELTLHSLSCNGQDASEVGKADGGAGCVTLEKGINEFQIFLSNTIFYTFVSKKNVIFIHNNDKSLTRTFKNLSNGRGYALFVGKIYICESLF